MSSADASRPARPNGARPKKPTGEHGIGYCRPPKARQYKKRQGRPSRKHKEESLLSLFKKIVTEKTTMNVGAEVLTMTRGQTVLRANFFLALQGNQQAMQNLLAVTEEAQLFQEPVQQGGTIALPYPCQSEEEYE